MGRARRPVLFALLAAVALMASLAQPKITRALGGDGPAPGAHDQGANWTTGHKQGLGTSTSSSSNVWYTLSQGVLTDVFYPTLDYSNVQDLQLVIVDNSKRAELERDATSHSVQLVDANAPTYRQVNTKAGHYRITKTYVTDPSRPTVYMNVQFDSTLAGGGDGASYGLYALFNPSLGNSALHDTGVLDAADGGFLASDTSHAGGPNFYSYLKAGGVGFSKMSNGFSATDESDGWRDLLRNGDLTHQFDSATDGNVVQTGQLSGGTSSLMFRLALGFGASAAEAKTNANATLGTVFSAVESSYESGWHAYWAGLKNPPVSVAGDANLNQLYRTSVMILHASEDKRNPGAQVAALATPWGDSKYADAKEDVVRDYHAVWSRDAVQQATGLIAAGDAAQANRIVSFLFGHQQLPAGDFPRVSFTSGSDIDPRAQHQEDETAFPIILAWQLSRKDLWSKVKAAADNIRSTGPGPMDRTERWEEQQGLSPSSIAAEIAALVCAADMAQALGDAASAATYLSTADAWRRDLPSWTFTTTGSQGDHRYYERIENNDPSNPDHMNPNDALTRRCSARECPLERDIVDGGALELVRLGVRKPADARVADTVDELDSGIDSVVIGANRYYYRYNRTMDAYGEDGSGVGFPEARPGFGHPWPLLSGERGEYELANGRSASSQLRAMAASAGDGYILPEQIWENADIPAKDLGQGKPTRSAGPLNWAAAEYVRLAASIDNGAPVETPSVVRNRYVNPTVGVTFTVSVPNPGGRDVYLSGELTKLGGSSDWAADGRRMTKVDATHYTVTLSGVEDTSLQYKYTLGTWGTVEKDGTCNEIPNRSLVLSFGVGGNQSQNDTVANWLGLAPC
jgi:glucoamylase